MCVCELLQELLRKIFHLRVEKALEYFNVNVCVRIISAKNYDQPATMMWYKQGPLLPYELSAEQLIVPKDVKFSIL